MDNKIEYNTQLFLVNFRKFCLQLVAKDKTPY